MSEKQKEALDKLGKVIESMSDREVENLLLVGEGMAIMSGIKEGENIDGRDKTARNKS